MTGLKILVVEDEFLLACMLEEELRAFGHGVIGPFANRAEAAEAARRERPDVAILDINLAGDMVYPLADELAARGIPFLFLTGYGTLNLPERFRTCIRLAKPYDPVELKRQLARAVGSGA
jgi:CheY-like chemotaxis protein